MYLIWIVAPMLQHGADSVGAGRRPHFPGCAPGARAPFLVVLKDHADLSGAAAIADRGERRRFVYQTLRAHAEAAQAPLRAHLDRAGIAYRQPLSGEHDRGRRRRHARVRAVAARRGEDDRRRPPGGALAGAAGDAADRSSPRHHGRHRAERHEGPRAGAYGTWGTRARGSSSAVADTGFQWDHPGSDRAAIAGAPPRTTTRGTTRSTTPRPATRAARTLRRRATTTATAPEPRASPSAMRARATASASPPARP